MTIHQSRLQYAEELWDIKLFRIFFGVIFPLSVFLLLYCGVAEKPKKQTEQSKICRQIIEKEYNKM